MKDMQVHLDKIRSDAAECLLLSQLATDGKREVFVRLAEHLNGLALEVEKTTAASGADVPYAADHEQAAATDHEQAPPSPRMLPWLLVIVLAAIAGAFFWVNSRAEKDLSSSVATVQSKPESSAAPQDDTKQAMAALLSGEQEQRKATTEQLGALAARVDKLERVLDKLESARAEIAGPSNKQSVGAEGRPTAMDRRKLEPPTPVNRITWQKAGSVAEPGRYMFTFGWLIITGYDLAIWRKFPNAAFTLYRTANEAEKEYRLGSFELTGSPQK
jgi:cell division protein FtsB